MTTYTAPLEFRAWDGIKSRFLTSDELAENLVRVSDESNIMELKGGVYKSNEVTLQQFTGLLDKNGTKIFGGDVVMYHDKGGWYGKGEHSKLLVEFVDGKFEPFYGVNVAGATYCFPWECEVLGNVFENPNLLKGNQ